VKTLVDAGLRTYPFFYVPPMGPTQTWAGRKALRKELNEIVESWSLSSRSTIDLMWADFGAGKTHALRYVEGLSAQMNPAALVVYCDVADGTVDFRSLFAQIVIRMPEPALAAAIVAYRQAAGEDTWLSAPWLLGDRDTPQALWALAKMGNQALGDTARRWLRTERITAKEATFLGVTTSIKTSEQAVRVLGSICGIARAGSRSRTVLLLDEFQRVGRVSQKRLRDVNAGITSLFNHCPESLSILVSCSLGSPDQVKYVVTPEVRSRVSRRLELRRLSSTEAREFVEELQSAHAIHGLPGTAFSPDAVVNAVVWYSVRSRARAGPTVPADGIEC
jgi:hypothetical protein